MTKVNTISLCAKRFISLINEKVDNLLIPIVMGNASTRTYWVEIFDPSTGQSKASPKLTRLVSEYVKLSVSQIEGWVECATENASCLSVKMHQYEDEPICGNMFMTGLNMQSLEIAAFARTINRN
ncbi:MAG: hypothetical protein NC339_00905 [Muribaculaceae bacterium]|nr:hypothetical protein [Muribaculaceae bacterium]